ncbi:hypothetical protein PV783_26260 [Chitinophaga sp. CC14]|uniref:hypothetical protein n=1 Tax=Chitinophaga sp. CC14 TaxID=3029199 RepID=UPI003B80D62B
MKLIRIFVPENATTPDGLYSIQYDQKEYSEYTCIMQTWRNQRELRDFFNRNSPDLRNGFWGETSIDEAIVTTITDAVRFEDTLFTCCQDINYELQYIFQPLFNTEYRLISLQKSKGKIRRSWLRLYALRIDKNCFIITGGAIKLTNNMRPVHLQEELSKLERTKRFLQSKNIQIPEDLNSIL